LAKPEKRLPTAGSTAASVSTKAEGKVNTLTDEREQKLLDLGITMKAWERGSLDATVHEVKFVQNVDVSTDEGISFKEDAKLCLV
jgi:hypothetical protein